MTDGAGRVVVAFSSELKTPNNYGVRFEPHIPLQFGDGTKSYVDVFRTEAPGRFPTSLQRPPWTRGRRGAGAGLSMPFVEQ